MLDISDIIDLTNNIEVFKKGVDYYKLGLVTDVKYNKNSEIIQSNVCGSKDYKVEIFLDKGRYINSQCECAAHETWGSMCKHIVATLILLQNQKTIEVDFKKKKNDKDVLNKIINQYIILEENKEITNQRLIEIKYYFEFDKVNETTLLSMKIGNEQFYVLKEIREFLKAYFSGEEYEFGKRFYYDPNTDYFNNRDKKVLYLIKEIIEEIDYIKNYNWSALHVDFISGKNILITNNNLKRLIDILEGTYVEIKEDFLKFKKAIIKKEDINLAFEIDSYGDNIRFNIKNISKVSILSKDYSVIFYEDTIFKISETQNNNLAPIFKEFNKKDEVIFISNENINKFMSYLYPMINETNTIEIKDNLKDRLYSKKCQPKLYIDKDGTGIRANLKYKYGEYTFDALTGIEGEKLNDEMIIRDMKLENRIMRILENSALRVLNDYYHINNEEDVYRFIADELPKLIDEMEIYYSDDFNTITIRDKSFAHISTNLHDGMNYFDFKFSIDGINQDELPYILKSFKEKKRYYRLKDGSFLNLEENIFNTLFNIIDELNINIDTFSNDGIKIPNSKAFYLNNEISDLKLEHYKRNLLFKELILRISEPKDETYEIPHEVDSILREYQKTGYNWIKNLSKYNFGGILADEMGLGKTIQILTYIKSEMDDDEKRKTLIIVPTSLIYNWVNEIEKFTPDLNIKIIDGLKKNREESLKDIKNTNIIITSYSTFRNDVELYNNINLYCCVLDEAQHIKNPMSKIARSVKKLNVAKKFALTGTPIENTVLELWSIFDFIMPGYLYSLSKFKKKFEKPIIIDNEINVLNELKKMIAPFILRRLKKDVLKELPDKIENKIVVELTENQKKVYLAYLEKIKHEIVEELEVKGFNSSRLKILAGLTRLRQICCDPSLFIENYVGNNAKMLLLEELLDEQLEGGHRIIIFSQFTSMLNIIKEKLDIKNIEYFTIDGSTKSFVRNELVNSFNSGEKNVFLVSLKAGGTGLNLIGADTVIHYDPWWNPATEDQATDRAHRIGQEKRVHVIKLITRGTIEEKIYELQIKKKKMINSIFELDEVNFSALTKEDVIDLFEVKYE